MEIHTPSTVTKQPLIEQLKTHENNFFFEHFQVIIHVQYPISTITAPQHCFDYDSILGKLSNLGVSSIGKVHTDAGSLLAYLGLPSLLYNYSSFY